MTFLPFHPSDRLLGLMGTKPALDVDCFKGKAMICSQSSDFWIVHFLSGFFLAHLQYMDGWGAKRYPGSGYSSLLLWCSKWEGFCTSGEGYGMHSSALCLLKGFYGTVGGHQEKVLALGSQSRMFFDYRKLETCLQGSLYSLPL